MTEKKTSSLRIFLFFKVRPLEATVDAAIGISESSFIGYGLRDAAEPSQTFSQVAQSFAAQKLCSSSWSARREGAESL